ncbi:hypothetical protein [Heyndrickxia ginsengihumi]|nr:hypothetical protein [Heyndrickxia ginsengihumi]
MLEFKEVKTSELNGINVSHFIAGFGAGVAAVGAGAAVAGIILT